MERGKKPHVLVIPYPTQGHLNPLIQFSKFLSYKGLHITVAITKFIFKTFKPSTDTLFDWDTISDGFDDGGFAAASSIDEYLIRIQTIGTKTLTDLIRRHESSSHPIDGVVYDAFMPWALDVAKGFGLMVAPFFTQPCSVNFIYYCFHKGFLGLPRSKVASLPELELQDMPSFFSAPECYPNYFKLVLNQWSNTEGADWILVNSIYEFEPKEGDELSKIGPTLTIGPTIPSFYIDNHNENDKKYELDLFKIEPEEASLARIWLDTKSKGSVVYVSFGSMSNISITQMGEFASGLVESNYYFIWVIRESEKAKLPTGFAPEKGLILEWSSQLEVLSNKAVGCFFTHCGWNSTLEALCLGVSMVGMPQWTDQPTIAKYVEDVWKVGVRVKVGEDGIVGKEEIKGCIRKVMEGDKATEFKENALKWKQLGLKALREGGSSMKHIDQLISSMREKISAD
ncbi:UDP-glycosyltransferase 74F2-like [Benincasa hispida]|uniref:UDP-glycosyltransferase 74F2-like n=1 Tax=Benincasa hispida TaxID=102211 RepID=UPI0019014706|nr:UDP-glycosyltransferase 74F2-like [Benincasa hispida]